ncbi:putative pectinesterase/pectinesterase inhibitor 21-like, partial [Trifolium medium]|nr:putative pectinesterase/pectinesterase inhibitor 21-like [Trifolium medium]
DRSAFFDCAIRGYQDTLYAHAHRQFYRNCEISGTVDFIFGYSATVIQNSKIIIRKPDANQQNIVVADGTDQKNMPTGVVLQNCEIMPEAELQADRLTVKSYLARPWKAYSRAIFMENTIDVKARVKWGKGVLTKADAMKYTANEWIQGGMWLPATGIPF